MDIKINKIKKDNNGEFFQVSINIPTHNGWIDNVFFNVGNNNYPLKYVKADNGKALFESEVFLETSAIYNFHFSYNIEGKKHHTKSSKLSSNFEVPDWAQGKIMYHIFIDRFNRGNSEKPAEMPNRKLYSSFNDEMVIGPVNDIWNIDFYGGDLEGIIKKLFYIKSLGVSILYLSPTVWSQSNHRYDTADYENVDPYIGQNEDLKRLCDIAHSMGMKVVLDAVFNHTGNDSKYFNQFKTFDELGAFESPDSKYSSFYKKDLNGSFQHWWGMENLPVCDSNSKEWVDYITGVNGIIDKWFELGIDGLRLDVADELSDEYIEHIRSAVKRNKEDGFILGEVWNNPMSSNRGYISSGKGMDSVMNYYFIDALIRYYKYEDTDKLKKVIADIKKNYPEGTINSLMNFTSTHDISRALNIFGTDEFDYYANWAWDLKDNSLDYCQKRVLTEEEKTKGKEIFKSYLFTLTFFPGILSIFYGDEIGIEGLGNLANRKPFIEKNGDENLLSFFRYLGRIRNENAFLEKASLKIHDINKDFFMFEREGESGSALIAVNRTPNEHQITLPRRTDEKVIYTINGSSTKVLKPYGGIALMNRRE